MKSQAGKGQESVQLQLVGTFHMLRRVQLGGEARLTTLHHCISTRCKFAFQAGTTEQVVDYIYTAHETESHVVGRHFQIRVDSICLHRLSISPIRAIEGLVYMLYG